MIDTTLLQAELQLAREEIAELKAQAEQSTKDYVRILDLHNELYRRNKQLERDAVRYDFIARTSDTNAIMAMEMETGNLLFGHELDAAIDRYLK